MSFTVPFFCAKVAMVLRILERQFGQLKVASNFAQHPVAKIVSVKKASSFVGEDEGILRQN